MDHGACNIIYIDRRAQDELVRREAVLATRASDASDTPEYFKLDSSHLPVEVQSNIESILGIFNEVHVCRSGGTCLSKIADLQESKANTPTVVLIDIPYDEDQRMKRLSRESRTPSPTSTRSLKRLTSESLDASDLYGMRLLSHISSEIQLSSISRLIIPVVVLSGFEREWASPNLPSPSVHGSQVLSDTVRLTRYLDAGAVDVLTSPLSTHHVQGLALHAYRAFKDAGREDANFLAHKRNRKLSWVGVEETKPYAYLREAMVSNLMSGICDPQQAVEMVDISSTEIRIERKQAIADAVGLWSFSAHSFTDEELLHAALIMLEHALQMPSLEKWRMPRDDLVRFLQASRQAYNEFVFYHNFRHVVDVLQATFFFLVQIGILPHYPGSVMVQAQPCSAIATLLKPVDALTLLISAVGHDVGHPGVNNAFLVALNAPLAQLYNDRSVLESFHCAAYSQILRRYWPAAFEDCQMRKLMINSILATDMGLHFKYMADLGNLQTKLHHNNNTLDGWNLKLQEEYRDLACGLLIKCADISNVARKFNVAAQWASILTDEFSNQGNMEIELNMPTTLFGGPPVRDNIVKMGESQIGFINIFARPLFEAVTDILPAMQFSVSELVNNKTIWERKIEENKDSDKQSLAGQLSASCFDGVTSPLTRSHVDLPTERELPPPMPNTTATTTCPSAQLTGDPAPVAPVPIPTIEAPTPSTSERKKRSDKKCGPRLRSSSPSRRTKSKSKTRARAASPKGLTDDDEPSRPRTSPSNGSASAKANVSLPSPRSQTDIRAPFSLNGSLGSAFGRHQHHQNGGGMSGVPEKEYSTLLESATSPTDGSSVPPSSTVSSGRTSGGPGGVGNRSSRFGFGKLWKRRWRAGNGAGEETDGVTS
ncbi:HD-domain/PDEase-like protein [Trichodelitschia bisporula]|uniref:Phosphodiesterase n=1 Tax=Trichodelitschia bisporula TaxID=703511 RepID=A0A6G1HTX0_9PEZI|nr:HD-domain/PDEase-like protein [Trichodelitschia bisporula]